MQFDVTWAAVPRAQPHILKFASSAHNAVLERSVCKVTAPTDSLSLLTRSQEPRISKMYNADGSLRAASKSRRYQGGNNSSGVSDNNFGNGYESKENQRAQRGGKQFQDDGVPAAGMKSQITEPVGHRSRAINEEAQLRNNAGSNIFSEADALQTREVNQRKLQDIRGHDIFSDSTSESRPAAGAVPGLSDAKKKALYSTSVFGQDGPSAAPQVSNLKKNEMSGSIVFGSSSNEQPRSGIGGVRKPPGGGSSLTFGDASPTANRSNAGNASGRRTPGGQSSFSFGW